MDRPCAVAAEIIPVMQDGARLIDCSTVDIAAAKDVAAMIALAGLYGLDAPVFAAVLPWGCRRNANIYGWRQCSKVWAIATPLFDIMGQRVIQCGDAGAGQPPKICNNMIWEQQ